MNKKFLISFLLFFAINSANANILWDINYGINLFQKNNLTSAKNYFMHYVNSNPNDEDGYYWLGKTYSKFKDEKNAQEAFKKAHELGLKDKNIEKIDFNVENLSSIEDFFDMAAMYYETGDLKEADSYADMMLKINPKSSSAYFVKAKVAQTKGDEILAKEYLNKAIMFNNKLLKTNLARNLKITKLPQISPEMYEEFALESYYSADSDNAIKYCKKYLNINPKNIDITNMLIDLYIKNNELLLAQSLIDETLTTNPNIQTYLYQAKIYEIKKDERLEATLLNAYKINPNNSKTLLKLGEYYLKKEDYINSKKYYEILINVNDELYEGYFGYIYSLIELREIESAINLIRKFISLNPNGSEADFLLAKICAQKNEINEALQYLNQAIEKSKNAVYFLESAKLNYENKEYEDSLEDLKMTLKMPNADAYTEKIEDYLILNYLKLNDTKNAQIYLNKKHSLDKNRIMYKYNLYIIYKLQGNEKLTLSYKEQIKKTKPTAIQDYIDLSEIYFDQSNYEKAFKFLDKGIKKHPNSFKLYSQKAKLYTKLNKPIQSKQVIEKFSKVNTN